MAASGIKYPESTTKVRCLLAQHRSKCPLKGHFPQRGERSPFYGSFHKGLQHDSETGHLTRPCDYVKMVEAIMENDQKTLYKLFMATGSVFKLVDPLASMTIPLVGSPIQDMEVEPPETLSGSGSAADMVELYSHLLSRDVPFREFATSPRIQEVLQFLNRPEVRKHLPYWNNRIFTPQNIFRGLGVGETVGPYLSQLLVQQVQMGALPIVQRYAAYPARSPGVINEWGRNNKEVISLQNGSMAGFAPIPPTTLKFCHTGRQLAEIVHNDPPHQFFTQAISILMSLKAPPNPTLPVYPNVGLFVCLNGLGGSSSCLADIATGALKFAWFQKWQMSRKLRPEVFSLWIDNVLAGRVPNSEYRIQEWLFSNPVLQRIHQYHSEQGLDSYTLSQTYREGSPLHPSWPSGHSTYAGACMTLLKIYFNEKTPWSSLGQVLEASSDGETLTTYAGNDSSQVTVGSEINKLANVAIGRDWAGVHYRSDAIAAILLGEKMAIRYFEDYMASMPHEMPDGRPIEIRFTSYLGEEVVLKSTLSRCPKCDN